MTSDAPAVGRSILDRMTKPVPTDKTAMSQVTLMAQSQVRMIIDKVLLEGLRHLGTRDDVDVEIKRTKRGGWFVQIEMT